MSHFLHAIFFLDAFGSLLVVVISLILFFIIVVLFLLLLIVLDIFSSEEVVFLAGILNLLYLYLLHEVKAIYFLGGFLRFGFLCPFLGCNLLVTKVVPSPSLIPSLGLGQEVG